MPAQTERALGAAASAASASTWQLPADNYSTQLFRRGPYLHRNLPFLCISHRTAHRSCSDTPLHHGASRLNRHGDPERGLQRQDDPRQLKGRLSRSLGRRAPERPSRGQVPRLLLDLHRRATPDKATGHHQGSSRGTPFQHNTSFPAHKDRNRNTMANTRTPLYRSPSSAAPSP